MKPKQRHRRPRHPAVERAARQGAGAGPARLRRRRLRHRPLRHRSRLFRDVRARDGRRHHGHGEPQSAGLQRHEVRARGLAADQRRQRPAGHPAHRRGRANSPSPSRVGERFAVDIMPEYIEHLLSYVDRSKLKPLKVVVHAGNGGAGLIIDKLEPYLPFKFIKVHHEPDGTFPNGVPNPMLVENHARAGRGAAQARRRLARSPGTATTTAASSSTSTAGSSRAITSSACWRRHSCSATPGSRIVHDPRLTWNTLDIVQRSAAARPCSRSRATRSSRPRCARWTASTAAR